jgi:arylsulfatase A-like enzyme
MGKNVLFIFADQMHRYALRCMGTPDIQTPYLDELAQQGVLFRNAYSSCPICTPFRINFLTGLYSHQTKSFLNGAKIPSKCKTLADEFNRAGFQTSYVGKWHIGGTGNKPIPQELRGGFSQFIGFQCYNGFLSNVRFYDEQNQEHRYGKHRTEVTTDLAIERLEKIKDNPFFMCVSYQAPHYPVEPAIEYEDTYRDIKIQRRPNSKNVDPYTLTHSPPSPKPKERDPNYQKYGQNLDEYLRLYYAMVTEVDANIGRLLASLDQWGLRENTVIIFASDHGDMQGSHGLKNKSLPYEESCGIPLIIQTPDGLKNLISDALVSEIDFFPTFLELAGIPTKLNLPGHNFAPVLYDKNCSPPQYTAAENINWKMFREGNMKLIMKGLWSKPTELYNLAIDPYELKNLINNSSNKQLIIEMKRKGMKLIWKK